MTLLLDVALSATVLFAAGSAATLCLRSASADVRRTIWRAVFVGTLALPVWLAFEPSQSAGQVIAVAAVSSAVNATSKQVAEIPWILLIWAAGCTFVVGRLVLGLAQVSRWGRHAAAGDDADYSTAITVPMTWGLVRPQVLLPAEARTWSADARDLVIRHEAAHVASRDWAWQTLARLVTAVLWFHPLAWVADRQLRREAERAADDAVLASGANPADYAGELVRVARSMTTMPSATVAAVGMVEQSSLERRVRHVLDRDAGRGPASWVARAAVAAFVAVMTVSTAALQQQPVYRVGEEGVTRPEVIKNVQPRYPQEAKDNYIQGEVILQLVVDEQGMPTAIEIVKSVDPLLDRAAIDAAEQWRFLPGRRDGEPVRVRVTLQFTFRLK